MRSHIVIADFMTDTHYSGALVDYIMRIAPPSLDTSTLSGSGGCTIRLPAYHYHLDVLHPSSGLAVFWSLVLWSCALVEFNWRNIGHTFGQRFIVQDNSLQSISVSILDTLPVAGSVVGKAFIPLAATLGLLVLGVLACWVADEPLYSFHCTYNHIDTRLRLLAQPMYHPAHTCMLSHSGIFASHSPAHAGFARAGLRCTTKISIDSK